MLFKRVVWLLSLAFGFLGVTACMAGVYAVWSLGSRLERGNDKVFAMIDKGLASSQERVRGVQMRVKESKIATTEIDQNLRDRLTKRAKEGLGSQLDIESRAEKLAGHLRTADSWLETSTESIRSVQQVLEVGNSVGAPLDPASLEEVLEKLTTVRSALQQSERTVDQIREFTASKEGESEENRVSRLTKLLGRILVRMGEIDTRLEESVTRLAKLRTAARQLNAGVSSYIMLITIGGYLVLAWIVAGQAALWLCGWKNCCRNRSSA